MTAPGHALILGVTGGIAAYRAVECVREFQSRGFSVQVVMTANACRFVGPLTFEALTGRPVVTGMFDTVDTRGPLRHTELADWADILVVTPATANIVAKMAHGIADDFLSTLLVAFDKPVVTAPAMNPRMYLSAANQDNLRILLSRGVTIAGPDTGEVACGHHGPGKMAQPPVIADLACGRLGRMGDFAGIRALVTAGPTCEAIDPVRFLSNRSSGRMGYAVADALVERGADVILVSGPTALRPHACVRFIPVRTAAEMDAVVMDQRAGNDLIVMAAAVADWQPADVWPEKWKKTGETAMVNLVRTRDILRELGQHRTGSEIVIGFAAETGNLLTEAKRKCLDKQVDMIVANDVSRSDTGFDSDLNGGFIITPTGDPLEIPVCGKRIMADRILDSVQDRFFCNRGK
ncbi:bifunctional phosphopantothenoylcysteine decarboxylase/phosphopantothenate--cysteine ligase CoaBC [bacterium]|nr:bifunctional phosphopantothenoylcysteine decarboxylase/phosphopantothenate--cysteine ligase CoaBC [candidate division CSSED10-310 bacterium]